MPPITARQKIDLAGLNAKPDIVSAVIMALDAQLMMDRAFQYTCPLAILPRAHEWNDARHAVTWWAQAHRLTRTDYVSADGKTRCMQFSDGSHQLISLHVPDGCEFEPKRNDDQMWVPDSCGAV